eukprot:7667789-Karenia_brevis.AAC.1
MGALDDEMTLNPHYLANMRAESVFTEIFDACHPSPVSHGKKDDDVHISTLYSPRRGDPCGHTSVGAGEECGEVLVGFHEKTAN